MKNILNTILIASFISASVETIAQDVQFITIQGDINTPTFEMSETEVTNQQYCNFLNEAWNANEITYNTGTEMVLNLSGVTMIHLGGTRVVKDHNNDGTFVLEEMENPINRCFIEYNSVVDSFQVVNPALVNWTEYFDATLYPNVVDDINDWAELNPAQTGFYGYGDADKMLPTLGEIRNWPVNHVRYYGAEGYADFYGYDLPTKMQWRYAGQGGQNYSLATSNGIADTSIAWYNVDAPFEIFKGHVQAVKLNQPNPYGIHDLGGSVWEWCKDWYDGTTVFGGDPKLDEDFFLNDTITFAQANGNYLKCLLGGSFNFFSATMGTTWNHAANMTSGNDHFGFRICLNSTNSLNESTPKIDFRISPNPATDIIIISYEGSIAQTIQVYSNTGKAVFEEAFTEKVIINTSNWDSGLYFVKVGTTTKKLIVN